MTSITNLICEYRPPLGIDVTAPRLAWQMQTTGAGRGRPPIASWSPAVRSGCAKARPICDSVQIAQPDAAIAAHCERIATEVRQLDFERFGAKPRRGLAHPLTAIPKCELTLIKEREIR